MNEDLDNIMVDISCPHCGEDIEIEDGDYETYSCPTCDSDFEYREDGIYIKVDSKVLTEESRTLEETNQQNKISSLIIIDNYMGQKEEIQKKQNIVYLSAKYCLRILYNRTNNCYFIDDTDF